MFLVSQKKRKEIPCYWEKQPGGCRKAHCAFKHQSKGTQAQADSPSSPESAKKSDTDTTAQDWRNGTFVLLILLFPPILSLCGFDLGAYFGGHVEGELIVLELAYI